MYSRLGAGSRSRTRGDCSDSGFTQNQGHIWSDFNKFAVLSELGGQNGGPVFYNEQGAMNGNSNDGKFITVEGKGRRKRLRLSNGSMQGEDIDFVLFSCP